MPIMLETNVPSRRPMCSCTRCWHPFKVWVWEKTEKDKHLQYLNNRSPDSAVDSIGYFGNSQTNRPDEGASRGDPFDLLVRLTALTGDGRRLLRRGHAQADVHALRHFDDEIRFRGTSPALLDTCRSFVSSPCRDAAILARLVRLGAGSQTQDDAPCLLSRGALNTGNQQ
jgi:hypothetical protein